MRAREELIPFRDVSFSCRKPPVVVLRVDSRSVTLEKNVPIALCNHMRATRIPQSSQVAGRVNIKCGGAKRNARHVRPIP